MVYENSNLGIQKEWKNKLNYGTIWNGMLACLTENPD